MQDAQNTRVVQDAYTAFDRGDIPGILATLDDNVVWKPVTGAGAHVPTAGERRGKIAAKTPAGKRFVSDWVMVFALRSGKVVSFQEFTDSAAIDRAYL